MTEPATDPHSQPHWLDPAFRNLVLGNAPGSEEECTLPPPTLEVLSLSLSRAAALLCNFDESSGLCASAADTATSLRRCAEICHHLFGTDDETALLDSLISDLRSKQLLVVPGGWHGGRVLFVVHRATPDSYTLAVCSCGDGLTHHEARAAPPQGIEYATPLFVRGLPAKSVTDSDMWRMLLRAARGTDTAHTAATVHTQLLHRLNHQATRAVLPGAASRPTAASKASATPQHSSQLWVRPSSDPHGLQLSLLAAAVALDLARLPSPAAPTAAPAIGGALDGFDGAPAGFGFGSAPAGFGVAPSGFGFASPPRVSEAAATPAGGVTGSVLPSPFKRLPRGMSGLFFSAAPPPTSGDAPTPCASIGGEASSSSSSSVLRSSPVMAEGHETGRRVSLAGLLLLLRHQLLRAAHADVHRALSATEAADPAAASPPAAAATAAATVATAATAATAAIAVAFADTPDTTATDEPPPPAPPPAPASPPWGLSASALRLVSRASHALGASTPQLAEGAATLPAAMLRGMQDDVAALKALLLRAASAVAPPLLPAGLGAVPDAGDDLGAVSGVLQRCAQQCALLEHQRGQLDDDDAVSVALISHVFARCLEAAFAELRSADATRDAAADDDEEEAMPRPPPPPQRAASATASSTRTALPKPPRELSITELPGPSARVAWQKPPDLETPTSAAREGSPTGMPLPGGSPTGISEVEQGEPNEGPPADSVVHHLNPGQTAWSPVQPSPVPSTPALAVKPVDLFFTPMPLPALEGDEETAAASETVAEKREGLCFTPMPPPGAFTPMPPPGAFTPLSPAGAVTSMPKRDGLCFTPMPPPGALTPVSTPLPPPQHTTEATDVDPDTTPTVSPELAAPQPHRGGAWMGQARRWWLGVRSTGR